MTDLLHDEDVDRAYYAEMEDEERELRRKLADAEILIEQMKKEGKTPLLKASFEERVVNYLERLQTIESTD